MKFLRTTNGASFSNYISQKELNYRSIYKEKNQLFYLIVCSGVCLHYLIGITIFFIFINLSK